MTTIYAITLTVGDRVGYARHHHWGGYPLEHGFGTVTKINRHGHITVALEPRADGTPREPKVFDKCGKERKKHGYTHLVAPATLEAELARHDAEAARDRAVDALAAEIAGMKTHRGYYYVTTEGKARLAELVAAIPVLE